jgi:GDP-4-dehydro-6-deoxy-D-mannose reductase
MVRAYILAVDHCQAGEAYNIGSGVSHTMQKMLDILLGFAKVKITVETDPSLMRPSDIQDLRADSTKFHKATGWKPEVPIEKMLEDTLNYWREQIGA